MIDPVTPVKQCQNGYACGDTCISKEKVCLKRLSSESAIEVTKRLLTLLKVKV